MLTSLLLTLVLQTTPPPFPNGVAWTYRRAVALSWGFETFLVCLDSQPTTSCSKVPMPPPPALVDVANLPPPEYDAEGWEIVRASWKFPPMLVGDHRVAVQACTADLGDCTSGAAITVTLKVAREEVKELQPAVVK